MNYHYIVIRLFPTVPISSSLTMVFPRVKEKVTRTRGIIGNISFAY